MTEPPRSQQFDDVYFSAGDGLAETHHVFLEGNDLPRRWQGRDHYTIAETGFGTGLNFLAAWKLFDETAAPGAFLDFISVEKYPLGVSEIRNGLAHWAPALAPYLERFLRQYPLRTAGFHRMVFDGRVALTLIFDDVNEAFPPLQAHVDSWFLDGFTPAKNPGMWTETVFAQMARLSAPGASFATFTAAGDVKRGLRAAGFDVNKKKGFGRKRDMLAGVFTGDAQISSRRAGRVAIIGGGLAGTSCAYVLKQYGFTPVIYEKEAHLASGASGNDTGLYNPRFTAFRNEVSDFYAPAYALARRTFDTLPDVGFNPCGALHLITDEEKRRRLERCVANWGWHNDHMRLVDAGEASRFAGVGIQNDALFLPDGGSVSPAALCRAYSQGIEWRQGTPDIETLREDFVILAAGPGMKTLMPDLPLETVRGQITDVAGVVLTSLQTALCYGGYIAPRAGGGYVAGATFQRWLNHTDIIPDDDADNLAKLTAAVPSLSGLTAQGHRAALRMAARDRFPVIGAQDSGRVYLSTAHGSHGIISALIGAHLLADLIRNGPLCLPRPTVQALNPGRFAARG